ncbi:sensor histidine kinase [Amycolatopsis sp. NPDC059657]|uniref:sensor histidine kinase n=1 Tax=Amycolatopsis sp. NPDC059657 TaxID=3346899 RepID=UPI00366EBB39
MTAGLRRLRLRLTLLYTLATAVCLVLLAAVAAQMDADSRYSTLDSEVDRAATALSRAVYYDLGVLHLEPLRDDVLAANETGVYVLEWTESGDPVPRFGDVRNTWLPAPDGLRAVADEARHTQETALREANASDGRPLRLAAAPVWNGDRITAVVVAAGDPAGTEAEHDAVVRWLGLGCLALVLLAAAAGHLLSGRSMRPAAEVLGRQEQFLAEAAHELRTPLATLRLTVDGGIRDPDQRDEALRRSARLTEEMGRVVAGLLARARLEAGTQELEREPLRLDLLVEQIVGDWTDEDVEISVTASECVVRGDPDLLAQAVRNLLANAVAHGGGTPVEVVVADGRISVRDHGPGVPPEDRERLFERSVTGAGGGTGIGLAIVRWVADLHGGSARLLDADGDGMVAELVVPVTEG